MLPIVARAGLELHVTYTEDRDDLGEGGGDGGPPQVLLATAPRFPTFRVPGEPQLPTDPTTLTAKLYCEQVVAWEARASRTLKAESVHRMALVAAWARKQTEKLRALADRPIPDTSGTEAGVEIDASATIFTAAQIAEAAPRPTILFLGGMTGLRPPSRAFRFPARLVVLIRSNSLSKVLPTDSAWARWADRLGGSFKPLSANETLATIARAVLDEDGG